jgi:hypothetical protein
MQPRDETPQNLDPSSSTPKNWSQHQTRGSIKNQKKLNPGQNVPFEIKNWPTLL